MSGSNRGAGSPALGADLKFLVAVLLACGVGLWFGYLEGYQAERHQNSTREYAEAAKQNAIVACANRETAAVADCVYDEINSSREASQAEQDLDAQQWMARWAALLTFFTLATTLISWTALRYLRDTFRETSKGVKAAADATDAMTEANRIARAADARAKNAAIESMLKERQAATERRVGERRQLRAYVDFESVEWTMVQKRHDPHTVWRGVVISLKNYGQTPADELTVQATFFLERDGVPEQAAEDKKDGLGGIMPHDSYRTKMLFKMDEELWEEIGNERMFLVVSVVATYVDAFGDPHMLSSTYRNDGWQSTFGFMAGTRMHT